MEDSQDLFVLETEVIARTSVVVDTFCQIEKIFKTVRKVNSGQID